jgi:hypothetical protein
VYDVLTVALEGIHGEYGIIDKIVKTTTDNGSNFTKTFDLLRKDFNSDTSCTHSADAELIQDMSISASGTDEAEIEFNTVDDILRSSYTGTSALRLSHVELGGDQRLVRNRKRCYS